MLASSGTGGLLDRVILLAAWAGRTGPLLGLFGLWLVFLLLIWPWVATHADNETQGLLPLDLRFTYSAQQAFELIDSYSSDTRRIYMITALTVDTLYPIVYALCLAGLLSRVLRVSSGSRRSVLVLIPILILIADYSENLSIVAAILRLPDKSQVLLSIASVSTTTKWSFVAVTIVVLLLGAVRRKRFSL